MIVNNLDAVSSKLPHSDEGLPTEEPKLVNSIVLKINIEKRMASFEETLLIAFLRAFKVDFQLETCRVPTFRGCTLL